MDKRDLLRTSKETIDLFSQQMGYWIREKELSVGVEWVFLKLDTLESARLTIRAQGNNPSAEEEPIFLLSIEVPKSLSDKRWNQFVRNLVSTLEEGLGIKIKVEKS